MLLSPLPTPSPLTIRSSTRLASCGHRLDMSRSITLGSYAVDGRLLCHDCDKDGVEPAFVEDLVESYYEAREMIEQEWQELVPELVDLHPDTVIDLLSAVCCEVCGSRLM